MLASSGISEWVAGLITVWLALQLPLGILIGFYLRRATVVARPEPVASPAYSSDLGWQEFLQAPAATPAPALRLIAR